MIAAGVAGLGLGLIVALLYGALGLPLAAGRVKPNALYGLRIRATLEDPAIWDLANRRAGRGLVRSAVILAVTTLALFFLPWPAGDDGGAGYVLTVTAILTALPLVVCVDGVRYANGLRRAAG